MHPQSPSSNRAQINKLMPQIFKNKIANIPEYTGPVEVKVHEYSPDGRGLFATEDIQRGELILAHKVFVKFGKPSSGNSYPDTMNPLHPLHFGLVNCIGIKLRDDSNLCPQFYNLYDGTNSSNVDNQDETRGVDYTRIEKIVALNHFTFQNIIKLPSIYTESPKEDNKAIGIWTSQVSYMNHSCSPNSFWLVVGDTMFVRAIRDIRKDEQIYISYLPPTSLSERCKFFAKHGFQCKCKQCEFDSKNGLGIQGISNTFKELKEKVCPSPVDNSYVQYWNDIILQLQLMTNTNALFSYHIVKEAFKEEENPFIDVLISMYTKNYDYLHFNFMLLLSNALIEVGFRAGHNAMIGLSLLRFYLKNRKTIDDRAIENFIQLAQNTLKYAYGSMEMISLCDNETYSEVVEAGLKLRFFSFEK